MRDANFFGVFVGIESPDPATLTLMKKKQNTRRNIAESIHKIYSYGMFVNAGFILGFDSEKGSVADAIVELIQDAAIPLSIVGLLYSLPGTQLTRRLEKEGRLHANHDVFSPGDQCTHGLNFEPARDRCSISASPKARPRKPGCRRHRPSRSRRNSPSRPPSQTSTASKRSSWIWSW
jgi:hypothetical protein